MPGLIILLDHSSHPWHSFRHYDECPQRCCVDANHCCSPVVIGIVPAPLEQSFSFPQHSLETLPSAGQPIDSGRTKNGFGGTKDFLSRNKPSPLAVHEL